MGGRGHEHDEHEHKSLKSTNQITWAMYLSQPHRKSIDYLFTFFYSIIKKQIRLALVEH